MTQFTDFGLDGRLLKALSAQGYTEPTPIQAQAISPVMEGRDILGIAQTGTGKTAAFALPILHRLAANPKPQPKNGARCVVLAPTRELATQIADSFKAYGANMNIRVATCFGGVKYGAQIRALAQGLDVLVAAPGRLLDHIDQRNANLSTTEILVLDEADQMLDMGFVKPIRRIVSRMPKERQNLFFSATMPAEIEVLANELLTDPVKVSVTPAATTVEKIDQQVLYIEAVRKRALLAELFANDDLSRTLVFTRTKRGADRVAKYLKASGVPADAIHGNKSQAQREKALAAFKAGQTRALIATDIAARGIDVSMVSHVIQYELPHVPESYVHRIGRTARAGSSGVAISFCADDERKLLKDIERVTRQRIPSWDRRNDKGLAVMSKALESMPSAEQALPEKKPKQRRRRSGDNRQQVAGERRQGEARPHSGERSTGDATAKSNAPWKQWTGKKSGGRPGGNKPRNKAPQKQWDPLGV